MKSFSNACGIKDSLRLMVEGPEVTGIAPRPFSQPYVVIGRDSRADLILNDPQVSRRHVYLQVVEGWAFWVDLESRTGSRTEAGPQKSGWLAGDRFLVIGPYLIRRAASDAQTDGDPPRDTPLAALAYGREPLPDVALEFLNGPSQSMFWPMHRVMSLIGSAKGCKFRLTDRSVSAFHASLVRTPAGLWVVDLRGGESITVNAVPVHSCYLGDGDVLGIGRYRIRMRSRVRDQGWGNGSPGFGRAVLVGRMPHPGQAGGPPRPRPVPDRAASAIADEPAPENARVEGASLPVPIASPASGIEILPAQATFPGNLNQAEPAESVLVPLMNQFGLMQQQMFDQFQQAMGMLVQMFGTMHREQMDVIREELDRVHQLSEELQALKEELAKQSRASAEPIAKLGGGPAGPDRWTAPVSNASAARPAAVGSAARNPSIGPGTIPAGVSSARVPPLSTAAGAPGHRPSVGAGAPPPPTSSSPLAAPHLDPSQPGLGSQSGPGLGPADSDRDTLVWLHQRIATLQHERESRWQKILKLLPGVS